MRKGQQLVKVRKFCRAASWNLCSHVGIDLSPGDLGFDNPTKWQHLKCRKKLQNGLGRLRRNMCSCEEIATETRKILLTYQVAGPKFIGPAYRFHLQDLGKNSCDLTAQRSLMKGPNFPPDFAKFSICP